MRGPWRFQFGIRALLLAICLLPPLIGTLYRKWQESHIWEIHYAAKQRRDNALVDWRVAYDADANRSTPLTELAVQNAERRYYAARQDVEATTKTLHALYGKSDKELLRAMEARRKK